MSSISKAIEDIFIDEKAFEVHTLFLVLPIVIIFLLGQIGINISEAYSLGKSQLFESFSQNLVISAILFSVISSYIMGFICRMVNNKMHKKASVLPDLGIKNFFIGIKSSIFIFLSCTISFLVISFILNMLPTNDIIMYIYSFLINIIISIALMVFAHEFKISDAFNLNKFLGFFVEYFIPVIIISCKLFLLYLALIALIAIIYGALAFVNILSFISVMSILTIIFIPLSCYMFTVSYFIYFHSLAQVYANGSLSEHFS